MGGLWLLLFLIFSAFGSAYLIFDNTVSVLGIVATLLCAGRFAEFTMIQWISSLVSIATYTIMTIDDPSRCVWLIHVLYSCTCSIITYITIRKKEKNQ
jgi:nicotinamide riboside transporter PnuC